MTLEACILMPLFMMIMLLLNGSFVMFMGQQYVTHTLVQSTKSLVMDPYSIDRVTSNQGDELADMFIDIAASDHISADKWYEDGSSNVASTVEDRFVTYLKDSRSEADALLDVFGIEGGVSGLDFSGSSVDNGVLTVSLKFNQRYVYDAFDLQPFQRELKLKVNLFKDKSVS